MPALAACIALLAMPSLAAEQAPFSATAPPEQIQAFLAFDCPLPPTRAKAASPAEDPNELIALLNQLAAGDAVDPVPALRDFVTHNLESRWQPALSYVLSDRLHRTARFSEAQAVRKDLAASLAKRSGTAATELAELNRHHTLNLDLRLGHTNEIAQMLRETADQPMSGSFRALRVQAEEGLHYLRTTYAQNLRCGPVALHAIEAHLGHAFTPVEDMEDLGPGVLETGLSCSDPRTIAKAMKLDYQVIHRPPGGGKLPVPAVMHWKFGHYSALLEEKDGQYLLVDRLLGFNGWVSLDTLTNEISGYFLMPRGKIPTLCRPVFEEEASKVCGKHCSHGRPPFGESVPDGNSTSGGDSCQGGEVGMPVYSFQTVATSLLVQDTPLAYHPPVGPSIALTLSYREMDTWPDSESQREYGHFGSQWSHRYCAFVVWESSNLYTGSEVRCRVPGGGTEAYIFNATTGRTTASPLTRAYLLRVASSRFERILPDGSKEVYSVPFKATGFPWRLLLSAIVDSSGNQMTLSYDAKGRLTSVMDAIGQTTTFTYVTDTSTAANFRRIAKVTDPFGRTALFQYNASGRLWQITDMGRLTSEFGYASDGFLNQMTTPYGTTRFAVTTGGGGWGLNRSLIATDPLGGKEVLAFIDPLPIPSVEKIAPPAQVQVGGKTVPLLIGNENVHFRNTCFWDKRAYQASRLDAAENLFKYATIQHWLVQDSYEITGILESTKKPLENRVWYNYPGQTDPHFVGTSGQPARSPACWTTAPPRSTSTNTTPWAR